MSAGSAPGANANRAIHRITFCHNQQRLLNPWSAYASSTNNITISLRTFADPLRLSAAKTIDSGDGRQIGKFSMVEITAVLHKFPLPQGFMAIGK